MSIAFDAWANAAAAGTGDLTWTHTPTVGGGAGTPNGVLVGVVQSNNLSDNIVSVTYGALTLTKANGAPYVMTIGAEQGAVFWFYSLPGDTIPAGAQTVTVDVNSSVTRNAGSVSLTTAGPGISLVDDVFFESASTTSPSTTLALGGIESFVALASYSGSSASHSVLTNWTERLDTALNSDGCYIATYNIIGTTDVTVGFTQNADEVGMAGIAFTEFAGVAFNAVPTIRQNYRNMGYS